MRFVSLALVAFLSTVLAAAVTAQEAAPAWIVLPPDRTVRPTMEPRYPHSTVFGARNSTSPSRFEVKAPANASNVLIVLFDAMG